jgi:hypothetical protein
VRNADTIAQTDQPQPGAEAAPLPLRSLDDIRAGSIAGAFR